MSGVFPDPPADRSAGGSVLNWRENYLAAARLAQPNRIPMVLGLGPLWAMRYAGATSWDMFYHCRPSYVDVYLDMVRHFDFCGWLCMNLDDASRANAPVWTDEIVEKADGHLRVRCSVETAKGSLTKLIHFPRIDAPWDIEPLVKDPERDYERIVEFLKDDPWERGASSWLDARARMGEHGIVFGNILLFPEWWHGLRGHAGEWVMDFYDHPQLMERLVSAFYERELELARVYCERVRPDSLMMQGSTSSMSLISPSLFRQVNMPFIQELTAMAKSRGVLTELHVCGKSLEVLEMMAADTDLNVMQPLEQPPGGNIILSEAKKRFGHKICLLGNVHTIETMDRGTPDDVESEVRMAIGDAGDGGGFILGTGDQVPGTAPEENLWAFVNAGKKWGDYHAR